MTGTAEVDTDGKAQVSVSLANDTLTEGAETLKLTVAGESSSVTINDTSLTSYDYTVDSDASSSSPVEEGGQITYTITRSGSGAASTVYVATNALNDTATQDVDFTNISSQAVNFASDETVKTVTVNTLTDSVYEEIEFVYFLLYKTQGDKADGNYAAYGTGYVKNTNALTASLSSSASSVNEGQTVTYTLSTNAAKDTEFDWTISGVSSADISGDLTGTATVDADGDATIGVTLKNDAATEGSETMTMSVADQSSSVTIADTSTTAVATYALASDVSSVDEGGDIVFTLTTTNVCSWHPVQLCDFGR